MRALFSFFSPGRLACLACLPLLAPSLALAQNPPQAALTSAADPAALTAPLGYQGITPRPLKPQLLGAQDWRAAHNAVADVPRGHADIVAWEAAQARGSAKAMTPTLPAAATAEHGAHAKDQPVSPPGAHHPAMHPKHHRQGQP